MGMEDEMIRGGNNTETGSLLLVGLTKRAGEDCPSS